MLFSGLAPGYVGLYQVNALVPANAPAGTAIPVVIWMDGFSSNAATIAVETNGNSPQIMVVPDATTLPFAQSPDVTVAVAGSGTIPTGSVVLSSGNYTSAPTSLNSGSATIYVLPGSLAIGSDELIATYTPDSSSLATYGSATGTATVRVTQAGITNITASINTLANRHSIGPFIYGNNDQDTSDISEVGYTYSRWSGNNASNYNWQMQTCNSAADSYFED